MMARGDHRYIVLVLVALLATGYVHCQEDDEGEDQKPQPYLSLNTYKNFTELSEYPASIYISQALSFIFTGKYVGQGLQIDESSPVANFTMDEVLSGALFGAAGFIEENNPPGLNKTALPIILDLLVRVIDTLRDNGTTGVLVKDFLPLFPYLRADYILGLISYILAPKWKQNFQTYLKDEFTGGINGTCKLHTLLWFNDVGEGKIWALRMADALAKPPSGLFSANINWVGNYKQCSLVNGNYSPPIKGKYCRAVIGFPITQLLGDLPIDDNLGFNYGLCVSETCNEDQVKSLVSNSLKLIGAFKASWVDSIECDDTKDTKMSTAAKVYTGILLFIIAFVVVCTLVDIFLRFSTPEVVEEKETPEMRKVKMEIAGANVIQEKAAPKPKKRPPFIQFLTECSMYTNSENIWRTDKGGRITCLNGIRFFSMCWIIWGHTYNYIADRTYFFLVDNLIDLTELNEQAYAQIIINALYGVDTFFLMSAMLLTISFLNKLQKSGGLKPAEWAYFYISRYWRLMPPFLIIFVLYIYIMPYWGSGPLWMNREFPIKNQDCHNYWWAFIVLLNNFVPDGRGSNCMGYLWYVPNDYQFYAICPIFLIILYRRPLAGKLLLLFTLAASLLILAFLTANVYLSRQRDIVQTLLDIWSDVYIKPYCRAAPYIVGVFLGYILFKHKQVKIPTPVVYLGWITAFVLFLSATFGGFTNHAKGGRRMDVGEYAIFFSLTRLSWPIGVAWMIFACHYGYGGVVNRILSYPSLIPFARIGYCCYLVHPPIMVLYYFLMGTTFHATSFSLVYVFLGNLITTFVVATLFTMFFEMPFQALEKLAYNPRAGAE